MDDQETIRAAMSLLGSRKSERKTEAARKNGKQGGRPTGTEKPLPACTCGQPDKHKATCRVYQTMYQRRRRARLKEGGETK